MLCGPSCAGKTTLGQYLCTQHGYTHIEASDYMYNSYIRSDMHASLDIADYAEKALKEKPEIVAEQIINYLKNSQETPIVITGFRAPDEFDWFIKNYDYKYPVELIMLDADLKLRYGRSIIRNRENEARSEDEFAIKDKQQARMGLEALRRKYKDKLLLNNKTLENLFSTFEARYKESL